MKYVIGFIFSLLFASNAMADQLVVKEGGWSGTAYVLNVGDSLAHCIHVIKNLSNIHKYSNGKHFEYLERYFRKEFICIQSNGVVSKHAYIYQIPYSKKDKNVMCLINSQWDRLTLVEECKNDGFTTRPIITKEKSVKDYVIKHNAK